MRLQRSCSFPKLLFIILGLVVIGQGFIGCATTTTINAIRPAEISLPGTRTLAILPFAGQYGAAVREDVYARLNAVRHFSLLDMSQNERLDKVLWEQIEDPRFLPEMRQIQADAVLVAHILDQITDTRGVDHIKMEEGTGRTKKVKQKNRSTGKEEEVDVEIMKTVLKPFPYVARAASLTASIKVISLKNRKVLAAGQVEKGFHNKYGGSSSQGLDKLPTQAETMTTLGRSVAAELVQKIAPTPYVVKVAFDKGRMFRDKPVKIGVKWAEKGVLEEAEKAWRFALAEDGANPAALYNLGVVCEARSGTREDLVQARDYYSKAAQIQTKRLYMDAMGRIQKRIKESELLEQQRRQLEQAPEKAPSAGGVRIY